MQHTRSLDDISLPGSWVTIGNFDGVHRGHQEIMRQLVSGAHGRDLPAVVITFHPHPAVVLGREEGIKYLTLTDEKAALLGTLGVDNVITLHFDRELAGFSAEQFMTHLNRHLGIQQLCIGYDFALGRDRQGNAKRLRELGKKMGYTLKTFPPVRSGKHIISSQAIRNQLAAGEVDNACLDLGYSFSLTGRVIHGDGRGRKINIPTANLEIDPEKLLPAAGVYACWTGIGGNRYASVTNIGRRPTFKPQADSDSVETHILNFNGQLYDQKITIEFIRRLRPEMRFPDAHALIDRIRQDIELTREMTG